MSEDPLDDRREVIAPLLSVPRRLGRPRADDRTTLNSILWVLRLDALWKTPSDRYGNSSTCHRRLQEWEGQGLPPRAFDAVSKWFPLSNGSYRNHCPECLHSKHVDIVPGDRASSYGGVMEPIGMKYKRGKGPQMVHRCLTCGAIRVNRIARDTAQPDHVELLLRLAVF